VNAVSNTRFSQDGFYDADAKLTYNLTPAQTFSFLITGGRLSWRWTPSSHLVLDVYGAYVSTRSPLYSEASKMKNVNRKIKKALAASRYLADTLTMQGYRNL